MTVHINVYCCHTHWLSIFDILLLLFQFCVTEVPSTTYPIVLTPVKLEDVSLLPNTIEIILFRFIIIINTQCNIPAGIYHRLTSRQILFPLYLIKVSNCSVPLFYSVYLDTALFEYWDCTWEVKTL